MWSVGKAVARGWFRLPKWGFLFWRTFGGWQLQFEDDCPGQKWQGLSRVESTDNAKCSKCLQQIFFKKSRVMEKFHLNLSLEMFGFRILIFMYECCFSVIFSCIHYLFTHHIYYVPLFFLNKLIKECCGLIFVDIFYRFVSSWYLRGKNQIFHKNHRIKYFFLNY